MILILLSSYNGSAYLQDFLNSLMQQSEEDWILMVRDDGSSDNSLDLIISFFTLIPDKLLIIKSNKNLGVKKSFNLLAQEALQYDSIEYIMFADQDDVWKHNKLEITLEKMKMLESLHKDTPLLVHTDLHVSRNNNTIIHPSLWRYERTDPYKNSLNYLLFQNTVTGCTMMLNRSLLTLIYPIPSEAIMHDWWIALIASSLGRIGIVADATIYYRQHENNTIGAKGYEKYHFIKKIVQIIMRKNEPYLLHLHDNRVQADILLQRHRGKLSSREIEMLENFINMPNLNFIQKRICILKYKCIRQNILQTLSLFIRA